MARATATGCVSISAATWARIGLSTKEFDPMIATASVRIQVGVLGEESSVIYPMI